MLLKCSLQEIWNIVENTWPVESIVTALSMAECAVLAPSVVFGSFHYIFWG